MFRASYNNLHMAVHVLFYKLLYFLLLFGLPPGTSTEWSSSQPSSYPLTELDTVELVRDAPLYPPLQQPSEDHHNAYYNDLGPDLVLSEPNSNVVPYNELETSIEDNHIIVTPRETNSGNVIETEYETKVQIGGEVDVSLNNNEEIEIRRKRGSAAEWDNTSKAAGSRRVKTGDTVLNIRGALRDAIGDAGAAPGSRQSSRVDTFVIRPASGSPHRPPAQHELRAQLPIHQAPKHEKELLVEAHSRARISCDLGNVTNLRWYKDNEQIVLRTSKDGGGGEAVWREADSVVIARATRGDAAEWRCTGEDRTGQTLTGRPTKLMIYEPVRAVYLAVDGRRLDAGNTWVPVRDNTALEVRCVAEGGVPPPELEWRLVTAEPTLDHRPYLRVHATNYSVEGVWWSHAVVTAARELHNATLQCGARQRRPPTSAAGTSHAASVSQLTAKLEVHVTYPPSFVISRWPGFGVSLSAGSSAALRCDVDSNPPARAWWLRDDARAASSPAPPTAEGGGSGTGASAGGAATLRWAALSAAHAGWYRCRATWLDTEYSSIGYYLNILSPEDEMETSAEPEPVMEEVDHEKVEVPLGGNVQFNCPKGSVGCWWRRVVGNATESWAPAGSHHAHGVLGIKDALYQEGGEYRCIGARAPDLARLRELKRVTIKIVGGATATALSAEPASGGWRLECGACGRGLRVLWVRGSGRAEPASLAPDLAQHCWRAVLHVHEPDEVWCVAAAPAGGAVAVFPARTPPPTPAPARHTVRALHGAAHTTLAQPLLVLLLLLSRFFQ